MTSESLQHHSFCAVSQVKLEPARKTKSNTKVLENDVMVEGI